MILPEISINLLGYDLGDNQIPPDCLCVLSDGSVTAVHVDRDDDHHATLSACLQAYGIDADHLVGWLSVRGEDLWALVVAVHVAAHSWRETCAAMELKMSRARRQLANAHVLLLTNPKQALVAITYAHSILTPAGEQ